MPLALSITRITILMHFWPVVAFWVTATSTPPTVAEGEPAWKFSWLTPPPGAGCRIGFRSCERDQDQQ